MTTKKLFAATALLSFGLIGRGKTPSALTLTCLDGADPATGNCLVGQVEFTGTGYSHEIHVIATGPGLNDDSNYITRGGNVDFTETITAAGDYSIQVFAVTQGGKTETPVWSDTFTIAQ
jgi:hypothetical protein